MISVDEALSFINTHTSSLAKQVLPLPQCLGYVLAEDIFSPIDSPPFPQSAMDGYALEWESIEAHKPIPVQGLVQTGDTENKQLPKGSALRIFTGAPLPLDADTVVMQEHVHIKDGFLTLINPAQTKGSHIRKEGSQINKAALAVSSGCIINAGIVGFLAGLGITHISVVPKPKIGIIVTGKELVQPGNELLYGQIYESNSLMLKTALLEGGFDVLTIETVDDVPSLIEKAIQKAIETCDIILLTGGVSVGDFDFVSQAVLANKAEIIFHKIKQKPGKPLLFARKNNVPIFGLPGNPASMLHCFQTYVIPCLQKLSGKPFIITQGDKMPINTPYNKKAGLTHFMKGIVKNGEVSLLNNQESYKLNPFVISEVIVKIPEDKEQVNKGDLVEVFWISKLWN